MTLLDDVIAANVRAERARRQWKQSDLAERLGWERASVGHLESGRRAVKAADLPALCSAFGVSLARLLDGADAVDLAALDGPIPRPRRPRAMQSHGTRGTS